MRVIDSHTEGEPTRLILDGAPDLGTGPLAERAALLGRDHIGFCRRVLLEPRGHDAIVGALPVPPADPSCAAGVVFFNPAGPLGMCGHGSIGLAVTLSHLGRLSPGQHRIETPAGVVTVTLHSASEASVENVESYRQRADVRLDVPGLGRVTGDVAWGGNWFFLTADAPCALESGNIATLSAAAGRVRAALRDRGITGADGAEIDHVEFFAPSPTADGRNFVLCPGGAFDRSPCGTGSSARLACLAAEGRLEAGQAWVQESVIGSTYRLHYRPAAADRIVTTITGRAHVTAIAELLFDPADPYVNGLVFC